jgi:hypothetical protein
MGLARRALSRQEIQVSGQGRSAKGGVDMDSRKLARKLTALEVIGDLFSSFLLDGELLRKLHGTFPIWAASTGRVSVP